MAPYLHPSSLLFTGKGGLRRHWSNRDILDSSELIEVTGSLQISNLGSPPSAEPLKLDGLILNQVVTAVWMQRALAQGNKGDNSQLHRILPDAKLFC